MMPRKAPAVAPPRPFEPVEAISHETGGAVPLSALVRQSPLIVKPDASLRDSLFALNQAGVQAGVVAEDRDVPLGIVTLRDLVDAITIRGADLNDPTFSFMTAAPASLPADASIHRARVAMTRGRLTHLVLLEADGRLSNLISQSDLPGFREGGADELIERITLADNVDSLAKLTREARQRGRALFDGGMGIEPLCQWMSGLNDLVSMRVIELVANEFDLPPVPWCWMVFGSEGRLEQTFATDQDNGLVFQPDKPSDTDALRSQFVTFGKAVNQALDICGFMTCPGGIMAGNPSLCLSADEWRQQFGAWMNTPEPEARLNAAIFFDFRPLYGQDDLVDELRQWLSPRPAEHPRFLYAMAAEALSCAPSLGMLGNFSYDGGNRYPHTIDIKTRGVRPFVDAARLWALQYGVWTTNTADRLRSVGTHLKRSAHDTAASIEAFELIQRIRIQRQLAGGAHDEINRIDPDNLTAPQRIMLKEAFKQAKTLQLRLRQQFDL